MGREWDWDDGQTGKIGWGREQRRELSDRKHIFKYNTLVRAHSFLTSPLIQISPVNVLGSVYHRPLHGRHFPDNRSGAKKQNFCGGAEPPHGES